MTSRWRVVIAAMVVAATAGSSAIAEENEGVDAGTMSSGELTVSVSGLKSDEGALRFVLFDSKSDFLKRPRQSSVIEIEDKTGTWVISDLPYGTYAVLVHHDVDGSGVMERHWYGKPKEPTGASNDAPSKFGPPKYRDASFAFESKSMSIEINVK